MSSSSERGKLWYQKNKTRHLERCHQYYQKHKVGIVKQQRQYKRKNKLAIKLHECLAIPITEARNRIGEFYAKEEETHRGDWGASPQTPASPRDRNPLSDAAT